MDLLGAYLSDDDSAPPHAIMMVDPIYDLRDAIIEDVSPYSLVPVIVNLMWLVEERAGCLPRYQKVAIICQVLATFPELNDEKHIHHSLVSKLYKLADTDNLLHISKRRRCCWCWC